MRRRLPGLLLPTAPPTAVLVRMLGASVLMAVMPSAVAPAADTVAPAQATAAVAAAVEYRFNLAPAPSPFAGHQGYYNASAWSWGGSLIHVPDDAAFPFHMFAEAELGACGVHAWQTNARVVHAVSKLAEGPYEWRDDPLPAGQWHAGPDISRASDGTFLLMTMNSNATAAHCVDGVGNFSCPPDPATGKLPKPGYPCIHSGLFRNRMYASHSPYGPWDEVHNASGGDVIPASINANAVAHPLPNGTVLIVGGGIHVAPSWSGPYSRVNRGLELNDPTTGRAYDFKSCPLDPRNAAAHAKWPKATCALEDIFVWFDPARLRWRWMAHQKLKGAGDRGLHQCDYFPGVGGFAQSDSENFWGSWTYDFWAPAPKILIVGNRTFLTNSACPTEMGPGDSRCFTFLQEVLSENEGEQRTPSSRIKTDDGVSGSHVLRGRYVSVEVGDAVCDATTFGAVGDGRTDDTAAIQKALDHCGSQPNGGQVVLPAPRTYLVVSLLLKFSHTQLHIPRGATLLGSDNFSLWNASGSQASAIIVAARQGHVRLEHIAITGGGTVDGQGLAFWLGESKACKPHAHCEFFRPHTVDFNGVTYGLLTDTLYTNSPNHVLELGCDHCELSHVSVLNIPVDVTLANGSCPLTKEETHDKDGCWQTASNTDSVDVHGSPFYIHDVNFTSGDDNVAVHANNTLVEDSFFGSGHGASIGSCGEGTYLTNITFRNITFESLPRGSGQNGCRIKTDGSVQHARIWNVTYQGLTMKEVGYTIMVTQDYNSKASSGFLMENVVFRDIVSTHAGHKFIIGASNQSDVPMVAPSRPAQTPVVMLDCSTELAHHANCHGFVLDNIKHASPISGASMSCTGVFGTSSAVLGIGPSCLHSEPQHNSLGAVARQPINGRDRV